MFLHIYFFCWGHCKGPPILSSDGKTRSQIHSNLKSRALLYIYIYKYKYIYIVYNVDLCSVLQGRGIRVKHVFSCEADDMKRDLIMKQHPDVAHVFGRVEDFGEERGYCYVCALDMPSRNCSCIYIYISIAPYCFTVTASHLEC